MTPLTDRIVHLAWTQIWQLAVLTIVVALIVKVACPRRPHLAHILWVLVLLKSLTPPVWSSPTGVFSWAAASATLATAAESREAESGEVGLMFPVAAQTVESNPASRRPESIVSTPNAGSTANKAATTEARDGASGNDPAPNSTLSSIPTMELVVIALGLVWLAGVIVYAGYAVLAVTYCRRMVRRTQTAVDAAFADLTMSVSKQLGLRQRVRWSVVDAAIGPVTLGWLRPTVVLPQALVGKSSLEELEPIVAHELTHVRRRDGFVGLLQVISQAIWWFHPLVWFANRKLSYERERCCDEEVIAELAYEPRRYGRSLLRVLELKRQSRLPLAAPGIRQFEVTRQRFEYLIKCSGRLNRRMPRTHWLVLLLGLALFAPGAGLTRNSKVGQAAEPQPAIQESSPESTDWQVQGRIVDHLGDAVSDAEVLLLGDERILVDAPVRKRAWFVLPKGKDKPADPPSTRTDKNGEFKITRSAGNGNRLAVIAKDPLFWEVSREQLGRAAKVEIKLPQSGELAIECDLPGKPPSQPVNIELKSFDGVHWNGDMLRFHVASTFMKNPGETVFEHLPPGQYSVQRNQSTKTGPSAYLITMADRQLVAVESDKRATVRIDRKVGRPLTGHVRGLEKEDLRYAHVTINYFAPGEEPGKDGKPVQYMTALDVIPITSDGAFKTDPIPPGKYSLWLFAVRAATPNQSSQAADFQSQLELTVPAEGDMPEVEIQAKPRKERGKKKPGADAGAINPLRVIDEEGKPVSKFEIKIWTAGRGSSIWLIGADGQRTQEQPLWGFAEASAVNITVRADGFASTIAHFSGPEREKLLRGEAKIVLRRGKEVQVRFKLPQGMNWPKDLTPEFYFDNLRSDVRVMWQPVNQRAYAETGPPDFKMLNARTAAPETATVRLADDMAPFRVAINSPGFLRFFERGPFTLADVKDGILEIELEQPAAVDLRFDTSATPAEQLPFDTAAFMVMRKTPGESTYLSVTDHSPMAMGQALRFTDLAPGEFLVSVRTKPKADVKDLPDAQEVPLNPGAFSASRSVTLKAGESLPMEFRYTPLDLNAFRGDQSAVVRVRKADGSPAAGRLVTVTYFDGRYGSLPVFAGNVPESGEITLTGLTDRIAEGVRNDPYTVSVDTQRVGTFRIANDPASKPLEFRAPPGVGDLAPDVELMNPVTGDSVRLSSLRGKVVCLEFWATWCGPCREPMQKLNQLAVAKRDAWQTQVSIVPLSIDETRDTLKEAIVERGLNNLTHYWSGGAESAGWKSPAAQAFAVSGVPTTILIGADGKILWRGHPTDTTGGTDLAGRIEAAIPQ